MALSVLDERALNQYEHEEGVRAGNLSPIPDPRRPEKQQASEEFCQVIQWHRKYAIRLLNGPPDVLAVLARPSRWPILFPSWIGLLALGSSDDVRGHAAEQVARAARLRRPLSAKTFGARRD
jgi:hypothetical protein